MKKSLLFILALLCSSSFFGQNKFYIPENNFTIAFYNVENLFDTIDDKLNRFDDEFLPTGKLKWTSERYQKKIKDIAKVITCLNINALPDIMGFVELENKHVLTDLISDKNLNDKNYKIIHKESPDRRGIDVGFIYRENRFTEVSYKVVPVVIPNDTSFRSRDILYVKGKILNQEWLHIFVNHWPSRREGEQKSKEKRFTAAETLKFQIDSIFKTDKDAKIFIMGDFNDEPTSESIYENLNAKNNLITNNPFELYNLMFDKHVNGYGTYYYDGKWNMLDNLIVSQKLLHPTKGFGVSTDGGQIYREKWILFEHPKTGDLTPNRTYAGPRYTAGVSDHLPVYVILKR